MTVSPELVENSIIKYPIEDTLIEKMPVLHCSQNMQARPAPQPMFITGNEFDEMIFIWEFLNNFYEYVQKDTFYIEELYAGLKYSNDDQEVRLICEIHAGLISLIIDDWKTLEMEDDEGVMLLCK